MLMLQVGALTKWLSYPAHSSAHPVIGFAANRYFRTAGIDFTRVHFAAHGSLEGMPDIPIFENVEIRWNKVVGSKVELVAAEIRSCEPKLLINVNSAMVASCPDIKFPTLLQRAAIDRLSGGGLLTINHWLLERQRDFIEYLHTCVLALTLPESEERWPGLFMDSPEVFASEMVKEFKSAM